MIFCDAHLHIAQVGRLADFSQGAGRELEPGPEAGCAPGGVPAWYACSCAHAPAEFLAMEALAGGEGGFRKGAARTRPAGHAVPAAPALALAFGLHPQAPGLENAPFLEQLAREGRIDAVGEAGFDLFTPAFRALLPAQEEAWLLQLELCERYRLPLVNHSRSALQLLFRDSARLKRLPAVIFHSFMGSPQDALSLLRRGINAYFSFGKPLLNGKKAAAACLAQLPLDRLLLETDAPYQTLKGQSRTEPEELALVYRAAAEIRGCSMETLAAALCGNFMRAFAF